MTQVASAHSAVRWNGWTADAFARAGREGRPVLLSLTTEWSRGAREMDRTTYADPATVQRIHDGFVPIRVDADERPDLAERYELGGIPTTAFLSPSGELLGGGTFVDAERLREVLGRVAAVMTRARPAHPPASSSSVLPGDSDDATIERIVFQGYDERHAGFGTAPKFPQPAPVHLALLLAVERGDPSLLERATRTLDAMGWGELFDAETGGCFRCCMSPDWTEPQRDLLLGVNAPLLDLFLEAAELTSAERYLTRARDLARFIDEVLRRRDGAWRVSADSRASRVFTDLNAQAAAALLHASRVFDDEALGRRALEGLEHVLLASYKPGEGVAHFAGGVRGLLTDQVAALTACLDAWEASGNIVYRMMAEELAHVMVRTLWDEAGGGFFDRSPARFADEPPGAPRTLKPFVLNCRAAMALRRLADASGETEFEARARATLADSAASAASYGADAAHLLLARRAVLR